jgi:hypothetical protein
MTCDARFRSRHPRRGRDVDPSERALLEAFASSQMTIARLIDVLAAAEGFYIAASEVCPNDFPAGSCNDILKLREHLTIGPNPFVP